MLGSEEEAGGVASNSNQDNLTKAEVWGFRASVPPGLAGAMSLARVDLHCSVSGFDLETRSWSSGSPDPRISLNLTSMLKSTMMRSVM